MKITQHKVTITFDLATKGESPPFGLAEMINLLMYNALTAWVEERKANTWVDDLTVTVKEEE